MAKRMGFSVFGLPHYTIWHLYEPSVDDLRHMEEMEEEKRAREQEEREEAERRERQKEIFQDPKQEHGEDDAALRDILRKDEETLESTTGETNEEKTDVDAGNKL